MSTAFRLEGPRDSGKDGRRPEQKKQVIEGLASNSPIMDRKVLFAFLYILIFPAFLLILSGDLLWTEGWIFTLWFLILCYSTIIYLYRNDPALLEERYKKPGTGNQERWDRYVVFGLLIGFIIWIVIMPL